MAGKSGTRKLFIGVDIGTQGVKAAVYDEDGACLGEAFRKSELLHPVPGSVEEDPERRRALEVWLQGWSLALAEVNYWRTGERSEGLLDVSFVTDEDIARGSGLASKIGAVTDAARPLPMAGAS